MQITFEEAYIQYLKYVDVSLKTQSKRYIKDTFENRILVYWKNFYLHKIKDSDYIEFQSFINSLGYSYNTKRNIHYSLSAFFNYCIKYYNLSYNVCTKVGCFKKKNDKPKEQDFYTLNEFKQFIKYVDDNIYRQFFITMFFTGTRPGEAMALKFSDIYKYYIDINKTIDSKGTREIGTPKTLTSYRQIVIDKFLYRDLKELEKYYQKKYNDSNYDYFVFGGIKPLSPTTINRHKEKACKLANIRKIKLHEFRHSHATLLLNKGIVIHEISKRLGHSDVAITLNVYTHTSKIQEKRVIKTLNLMRLFKTF